ncbi:MAG TPA: DUF6165 family protein [Burkholderiaceae bacterium]|jgi:hypothetical protein|nr:DUF6165 family protein [Burkholderiaceae bacterium]
MKNKNVSTLNLIYAPVSVGELLDKITILEIKSTRISDATKKMNVDKELSQLRSIVDASMQLDAEAVRIVGELKEVNSLLWDIEDAIRNCERHKDFGDKFVELARSVYLQNDQRALLKKQLNELTGSELVEEKSYAAYRADDAAN